MLIDNQLVHSIYLGTLGYLALVLLMSTSLALDFHQQTGELKHRSLELAEEIERRKLAELALRARALSDALTGLPNRAGLLERMAAALIAARREGGHTCLLLLDLDQFRTINDALGHNAGDQILRELGQRLDAPYATPALLARPGGDEFVLLPPGLQDNAAAASTQALQLAAQIAQRLQQPLTLGFNVNASIGIALIGPGTHDELEVLRHAELALYAAKAGGRNRAVVFSADMQDAGEQRLQLTNGLRNALEHDQLEMHYQPKVDAKGAAVGAEALVRWHHPELGNIPPDRFIGLAEESGLIQSLGCWVLARACAELARLQREGVAFPGRMSVNVSAWQVAREDFVETIVSILERHATPPDRLTLEITESVLLVDPVNSIARLAALRALGLKISIDDFGIGYSSLSQLNQLPLDEIKIDKSFVDRMLDSERAHQLVATIVSVARQFKLAVVAEGVETVEQNSALIALNCDGFQGYLHARPMPASALQAWLRARAA